MSKIPKNYLEKVYAGFLAKAIGVRLGAPVEPSFWTIDTIYNIYGDIRGYVKNFTNFAADDDTNGPIFFIRALEDYGLNREITAEDVGNTWLNYTSEAHGMFWWGGYGISTEHTAYLNLTNGIKAPMSGSIKQNGETLAEQIGGQIFIDSWGLVCPGNVKKAAEYAEKAASVAHDRNGIYGGMFIAACIARAFDTDNISEIIKDGLSVIPRDSEFARVNNAVINFHKKNPSDFRLCFRMLEADFGYDKYYGICHMIPNAGVVTLALLYGEGSISRSLEIATMCGWDTDCNAGNVGTIVGVAYGLEKIEEHYRKPINDMLIASSLAGSLNIVDIPTFCKFLAIHGYRLAGEKVPEKLQNSFKTRDIYYDFEIPGTTHGMRIGANRGSNHIVNTDETSFTGKRSLKLTLCDHRRGDAVKLFFKPYYRRKDFDDDRYMPFFSPQVYSGQKITVAFKTEKKQGSEILMSFYVRKSSSKKEVISKTIKLQNTDWQTLDWTIPDTGEESIDEIGLKFENSQKDTFIGNIFVDNILVDGKGHQKVNFSKEIEEFGGVSPFTFNRGKWVLENGKMKVLCLNSAEAYTGNYYTENVEIKADICPENGLSHNIAFRVKGAMMGYHVGFNGKNKVQLLKNDHGFKVLAEKEFKWEHGKRYEFEVCAVDNKFTVKINGKAVIMAQDNAKDYFKYGMYGYSLLQGGRAVFENFEGREI